MNGEVPQIYWYVFWVGLAIVVEVFGFYMAAIIHRKNMRVIDLLKSYADKGIEPPAAVAGLLSEKANDPGHAWRSTARGARLEQFTGFLFTGCVIGGVAWWLIVLRVGWISRVAARWSGASSSAVRTSGGNRICGYRRTGVPAWTGETRIVASAPSAGR